MSVDVVNIERLEVKFDSATALRHKQLYANGRMQVRVLVLVSGEDIDFNEVSLHGHPALQSLRLISYNGSRPLEGDWNVSTLENRYAHEMTGGIARATPLVPAAHNRITDPAEPLQIYEFWVTSNRPGSIQIAAEITLNGVVVRTNGQDGRDNSLTLEALSPVHYPLSHFTLEQEDTRIVDRFDAIHRYGLGLYGERRSIHLLDWFSTDIQKGEEDATLFFFSGDISDSHPGVRTYFGYIAPVYGTSVSIRGRKGYRSAKVNQQPGKLAILVYLTPDLARRQPTEQSFGLTVVDEFGTEHFLRVQPDLGKRSFKLG